MDNSVTICIPTYEMKGRGVEFLDAAIESIVNQTFQNWNVIVSDQSNDSSIKECVERWQLLIPGKFQYIFSEKRGSIAANLNNAIKHAKGDIVKFLLQDDFFYSPLSLEKELDTLGNFVWSLSATIHLTEDGQYTWHLVPAYTHDIYRGANTIGSPSLMMVWREHCLNFDEELVMLVDCDYYRMMYDAYGYPSTTPEITTVSRVWSGQHQRSNDSIDRKEREVEYTRQKFGGPSK
jgi:glycosyltransferase involved in cell wall biosynthesis